MANVQHGHAPRTAKSPTHRSWLAMKVRCDYPYTSGYKYYGGKGITYDPAWRSFDRFLADMGPRPSPKHDLARRDHSRAYCRDNCLWQPRGDNRRHAAKVPTKRA